MSGNVLGIDVGGTNIRAGIVTPELRLSKFVMTSSRRLFETDSGCVEALANYVREYCKERLNGELPAAVCIGFPSTIDRERTRLLSTPNLPGLDGLEITGPLTEKLGVPVYIERDVNLLLLSDLHAGGLEKADSVIGCYIGTGIGNALYLHGRLYNGKNGVAGELGHIPVLNGARPCGCGNTGCMETVASGRRLEELWAELFPQEKLGDIFEKHGDDPMLQKYVDDIALPIATEVNILDPEYVVLGGGVLRMKAFPMKRLTETIRRHARKPLPCENLEIVISTQNQESGVIGAGIYALRQLRKGQKQ